jgi:hypothetical protein
MNLHIKKSRIFKLLLPITTLIVLVFIINQAQAGAEATRLKALESAVYYDENTNLEWLAGPDRNTNWTEAKKWVESLNVAGGGWRMPTRKELKTLYQEGVGTHNMTPLLKTTGGYIWSSETKKGSLRAHGFLFDNVDEHWGFPSVFDKRGFAVRSRK